MARSAPYQSVRRVRSETPSRSMRFMACCLCAGLSALRLELDRNSSLHRGAELGGRAVAMGWGCACRASAQGVARAADGLDQSGALASLELVAEVLDAHINEVRVSEKIEAPPLLEDLLAREHLARVAHEELQ